MDVTQAAFDEEPAPGAFEGCTGLESLVIEEGAKKIGKRAFYGCTGLQGDLEIPNSVPEIGKDAFTSTSFDDILVHHEEGGITGAPWGWDGKVTWLGQ